jgi:hypothetical protein
MEAVHQGAGELLAGDKAGIGIQPTHFALNFEDGVDLIALADGLTFDDLAITIYRNNAVMVSDGTHRMILRHVDFADISADDFTTYDDSGLLSA